MYNDTVWFLVQSKMLAWVFVVEPIVALGRAGRQIAQALLLSFCVGASLPASIQYLSYQGMMARGRQLLTPAELTLLQFFKQQAAPGAVVLARPEIAAGMIALTHCRAPSVKIFPYYFMSRTELQQHESNLETFWRSWRAGGLRSDILELYHASYVVVERQRDAVRAPTSALESGLRLEARFANERYQVYAVAGVPQERR
jgi:hypothetical protein